MRTRPENFKGVKGKSGRKSAYQELADARELEKMYFDPQEAEEVRKRIESGQPFSIRDRHLLNALEGDQKAITPIFAKVYPDKLNIKADKTISEFLDEIEADGQKVEDKSPLQNSEQEGKVDTISTESSAS